MGRAGSSMRAVEGNSRGRRGHNDWSYRRTTSLVLRARFGGRKPARSCVVVARSSAWPVSESQVIIMARKQRMMLRVRSTVRELGGSLLWCPWCRSGLSYSWALRKQGVHHDDSKPMPFRGSLISTCENRVGLLIIRWSKRD